ncbi:hypothetical protein EVAR_100097_1 [Eumeta japonica]|uniref:Uncharacterized protein n=1 Tax=Eumeta variegata TaxID=151549 RepID=A0A4C1YXR3_EUMVA|nr:hypothetical protein EVAR_100097_1 [Eumeta japonica]
MGTRNSKEVTNTLLPPWVEIEYLIEEECADGEEEGSVIRSEGKEEERVAEWATTTRRSSDEVRRRETVSLRLGSLNEVMSVVFNIPYTLVDVTVGNFLRMCLANLKRVQYLSILSNQYSIHWIEIRSGEAESRVSEAEKESLVIQLFGEEEESLALVIDEVQDHTDRCMCYTDGGEDAVNERQ